MTLFRKRRLRTTVPGLVASLAASPPAQAATMAKQPGETKVVMFMGGDYGHNPIPLEMHMRSIFAAKQNWRLIAVMASDFFTPELISDADLLILSRHSRPDDIAWRGAGLADSMRTGVQLWTDENVDAIVHNVEHRGMGLLALHNTISSGHRHMEEFLGITPVMHKEIQPLWVHNINQQHPVTRGIGNFFINLDEQFAVILKDPSAVTLFETTAMHDKRQAAGGWCLNRGNGRIAGLLPGHQQWAYRSGSYQHIIWRSAHWAMKRDIPPYPGPGKLM